MSTKKARVLTLRGSKWARGGKNGDSALLNDDGCSCCLGVDALSRGIDPSRLRGATNPENVYNEEAIDSFGRDWTIEVVEDGQARVTDSDPANYCMGINDAVDGGSLRIGSVMQTVQDDCHRVDLLRPYFRNLPSGPVILRFRPDL